MQQDLRLDIDGVLDAYYPLQRNKDICFEVARLLMGIKDYEHAVELFAKSNEFCGVHHVTCHNMGICEFYSGQLSRARQHFHRSLEIKPGYREAVAWLDKIAKEERRMELEDENAAKRAAADAERRGEVQAERAAKRLVQASTQSLNFVGGGGDDGGGGGDGAGGADGGAAVAATDGAAADDAATATLKYTMLRAGGVRHVGIEAAITRRADQQAAAAAAEAAGEVAEGGEVD